MDNRLTIRTCQPEDAPWVVALWNKVFEYAAPHQDPHLAFLQKITQKDDLFLLALISAEPAGTVMGGFDGHRGWVYSLAVLPRYRRRGIARALMAELEERLSARGCGKVNLQILTGNEQVVTFYESLGYALEQRISMGKRLARDASALESP